MGNIKAPQGAFLLAKYNMEFYNNQLNKIDYSTISWDNGQGNFGDTAKNSQLIYHLKKFNSDKKIGIVHHARFQEDVIDKSDLDFLLVNCSDHNYALPVYQISKKSLVIDSNFNKSNYYPFHLLFSSFLSINELIPFDIPRPWLSNCINRSHRIHRIYTRVKIADLNYNRFKFVWFRAEESNGPLPATQRVIDSIGVDNYNKYKIIDANAPRYVSETEFILCSSIKDYTDGYLNVVVESTVDDIGLLTEKIYKPIRAGQLFLVQGPPGAVEFLRSIGFDTFDDYIDHSYDTIKNWKTRSDCMLLELERVFYDIEKIYFATIQRRLQNLEVLRQYANTDPWTKFIVDQINS